MEDRQRRGDRSSIADIVEYEAANAAAGPAEGDHDALMAALAAARSSTLGLDDTARRQRARQLELEFIGRLATGTSVVIELEAFAFVTGQSRSSALKAFIDTFGRNAKGWAFEVDVPMSAGGSLCTR